ncbi:hypothetical protein EPHNCH_1218 [Anaplasma phagocytophilum str. NCH-1]|uniref:Uncharacterized protein n=1 Tax=Anaplasma phagocytophilum str. NCH-1 TaxID=1359161 RepID=A0A0F3N621_ANAPH|nr:hypothetical protein YYU_04075 [Anaplasma phagocytophilum str. HZ2]KJV63112.1 hypothetical protein EPHNCH_1218 [Anaplasma phagocytophilum str. NCH-1]
MSRAASAMSYEWQDSFSDKQRAVDAAIGQIERAFAWIYYDAT